MLFCKGADNVMFERADRNLEGQEEYVLVPFSTLDGTALLLVLRSLN